MIERISSKLDGWQKAYLSFEGKITLIQSCLTHMPCYFLSSFKIPASMAARIERLQRDFLWSGVGEDKRDHLVSWDVVCNPKTKGGLGFGRISLWNSALLGKWLWRYPREGSALWHHVMNHTLMVRMPTLLLDGHIVVLGRLLHKSPKSFLFFLLGGCSF